MMKLNGTVTLSILEEDNTQRVIFRIIPLCTKEGYIFQNRKASYPDLGSLRIIPDKREQSSFKERMREMGNICCVQLYSEGKELTKIRQNRNYDPNQGEDNQYAIYSDVICGFAKDAVFEVFQENQDPALAVTENVLFQRGMVLYGPVRRDQDVQWETMKPFGNEEYLLHTAEAADGAKHTYYWNPAAIVTWRQRKKALKRGGEAAGHTEEASPAKPSGQAMEMRSTELGTIKMETLPQKPESETMEKNPFEPVVEELPETDEMIPIGIKLAILDETLSNEEHISGLNKPVSDLANRLENATKAPVTEETAYPSFFRGTPIAEAPKNGRYDKQKDSSMYDVVENQLKEKKSNQTVEKHDHRHVINPLETLKSALHEAWQIPGLQQDMVRILGENRELMRALVQSSPMERQARIAYSAAKAQMDEMEAERLALLVELDKVKANYQHTKEKMLAEMSKQKQDHIAKMEEHLTALREEKTALEEMITSMGNQLQDQTIDFVAHNEKVLIAAKGSDFILSPTVGYYFETLEIVEYIRTELNALGFMCNQDVITEFLICFSLFDEISVQGRSINEAEIFVKCAIRAMGLLNVSAFPGAFGSVNLISLLPENDLRTPTVEVSKHERATITAYGHKTIHLYDGSHIHQASFAPVIRVPYLNKIISQDKLNENGKPVSLKTLHAFSENAQPLSISGEAWFDTLEKALMADGITDINKLFHVVRMFGRIASPQLVGGFMEAADAAVLAWVVPVLKNDSVSKENTMKLIGALPRSVQALNNL